jgi:uncharacterized protein (DUF1778 family)
MSTPKAKPRIFPNVSFGGSRMNVAGLRTLAKNEPKLFSERVSQLVEAGKLQLADIQDMRGLFLALADCEVPAEINVMGEQRAIMASAFPLLVGNLTIAGMVRAYDQLPTIGQELVTDVQDGKRVSTFANVHSLDVNVEEVTEMNEFPEIGADAEKVEIRSKRNGRQLVLSMEAIEENNVADFVNRVNALAEIANDWVEEQTLARVTDKNGSRTTSAAEPYVYRPNGSGAALYSSTANTPGTRAPSGTRVLNNALVDETDLENVRTVLATMRNNRNKRISIPMSRCQLVVPDALAGIGRKLLNSEYVPGVQNEINNWGPRGSYRPAVVSSPKLDDISTTAWYLGDFKSAFLRKTKLPFEYVTLSGNTEAFVRRREGFRARIAWDVEIGALDYVYVVQSLAGTTYVP